MWMKISHYSKWIILLLHFISFFVIILPTALSFTNAFIPLIFLLFEVILLTPIIFKKKHIYFYILWEFQFFLLILFSILLNPQATFQVDKIAPITLGTIILFLIGIEALILVYLIFSERAIKHILLFLSLSTTFLVFLIVLFIAKEGFPAFQENDPAAFITGTTWQPSYQTGITDTINVTTTVVPYHFTFYMDNEQYFIKPNNETQLQLKIKNTGGINDTIEISTHHSSSLPVTISPTILTLQAEETKNINLTVTCFEEGIHKITIQGVSQSSSQNESITFFLHCSQSGVDLTVSTTTITISGSQSTAQSLPFQVTNTGFYSDNYTLSCTGPTFFRPSIEGTDSPWNYTSSTGVINLAAGETKNLSFLPRITSLHEGTYELHISAASQTHEETVDNTTIIFIFQHQGILSVDSPRRTIPIQGQTTYHVTVKGSTADNYTLTLETPNDNWRVTLLANNQTLLQGGGTILLNFTTNDTLLLQLNVEGVDVHEGDKLNTSISLSREGSLPTYGILPFIIGTFITTCIAILIAAPLGLGCAIFLAEYCPKKLRLILRPMYELLAGIPSVIYGLWGFLTFGPLLAHHIYPLLTNTLGQYIGIFSATSNIGEDVLTASIVLSIMILPIIITLSEDSIRVVRHELKEGSLALGATRWQTMRRVILPEAKSGVVTSIILATGRAIGETMAVLMIVGAFSKVPSSLFDSTGTMTTVIAGTLGWSFTNDLTRHALFAIGIILFIMVFILNIIISLIHKQASEEKNSKRIRNRKIVNKIKNIFLKRQHKRTPIALQQNNTSQKTFKIISYNNIPTSLSKDKTKKTSYAPKKQKNIFSSTTAIQHEKIMRIILMFCAICITFFLFFIIGDIIIRGGSSFKLEYLYLREISGGQAGGFANAIIGSLQLVGIAILFAAPLAIGAAIYVQEYTKKSNIFTKIILFTSDTLASTPSIVFGAFGFLFFVIFLEFRFSMLAGGITLGIMVIPILLRSSIEAIKAIPCEYKEGALALGATKWQTIRTVVLPPASPSITSGVIISIGRAIGETAAVIFTAGYSAHIATSLFHPTASMPNMIFTYFEVSTIFPETAAKVYSAALILIIVVLALNTIAKIVSYRASRMMKH
jgi:phosphate transport system permease protein